MSDDMVKVYEEELFDNSNAKTIWLNDVLEEENIIYENKIIDREDSLFILNFMTHRIIEVYVPKFYEEKVLRIINEYHQKTEEAETQDIPELADYSGQESLPNEVKIMLDTYNNAIWKDQSVKNNIINKCVELNLKEYNCKIDVLERAKFEESLIAKRFHGKYNRYLGEGYSANFNIDNQVCEIYTISLDEDLYKRSNNVFSGTYIHFHLDNSYEESFCYGDETYQTRLEKEFVESADDILKKYDYTIIFALQESTLDFLISDYYIIDMNAIDEESLSKNAMVFKLDVLKDIILSIRQLIDKYIM